MVESFREIGLRATRAVEILQASKTKDTEFPLLIFSCEHAMR